MYHGWAFLRSRRDGLAKRFHRSGVKTPARPPRTPDETDARIIAAISMRPSNNQKMLVARLVVSGEVVGCHLRKIVRETRITSWKKGRTRVCFPLNN